LDVEVLAMRYRNRAAAGQALAAGLADMARAGLVVLGLPRGGVVVAFEVASILAVPLDVIVVRKLGAPFQPELAMGAIGEDGVRVLNQDVLRHVRASDLAAVERRERYELARRIRRLRGSRSPVALVGRTALIVDDGIATGSTASAAAQVARARGAARVVLAAPVASPNVVARLRDESDDVIVLDTTETLDAIGSFYDDFTQVTDDQVRQLLQQSR
jgi:putative phosphoribosyl transferase